MSGSKRQFEKDGRASDLIDHVLGEGDEATRDAMRDRLADDVDAALECAELRTMFDTMRGLETQPSGTVAVAVRGALSLRARRRGEPLPGAPVARIVPLWLRSLQVVGAAAILLCCLVMLDEFAQRGAQRFKAVRSEADPVAQLLPRPGTDDELDALLDADRLPVTEASFAACVQRFESLPIPESFTGWLDASAEVEEARRQFALAGSPERRAELLRSMGVPDLGQRTRRLADTVALRIVDDIVARRVTVRGLSLAMRSMLATGSSLHAGEHSTAVKACALHLVDRLGGLDEGDTATALAALADLAVVEGGELADAVGRYTDRLARSTLTERVGSRPGLLHWATDVRSLADAGRLLRVAPAFGVHAGLAFRARMMIAAHLDERLERRSEHEAPTLLAAQLYGFGDLIDLDAAERALRLWRPRLLLPDFVALHHIAWGKRPARAGWAAFQQELRGLSGVRTPAETGDAAALLLCLSTGYAAPGAFPSLVASHDVVAG